MARPPLPLGTYGKIKTWQEGRTWLARAQFRDYDGIVRPIKRNGKTKAPAERELKAALADRRTPVKRAEITPETKAARIAQLWLAEIERAVEAGTKSPGTLDTYRSIYRRHIEPTLSACESGKSIPRLSIESWKRSSRRPSAGPAPPGS